MISSAPTTAAVSNGRKSATGSTNTFCNQTSKGISAAVSAAITVLAALALFRFKVGIFTLLGACAAAGLAVTLLR